MTENSVLYHLLNRDLYAIGNKFHFISEQPYINDRSFLIQCIGELDSLSFKSDDLSRRKLIAISALLWQYYGSEYKGLKDYLILYLSRIGYAPSTIILDGNYDSAKKSYQPLGSLINEFAITLNQVNYEITCGGRDFLLTEFQKKLWDEIEINRLIGISAPTSAGKSFIIALKAMDLIQKRDGVILYVVPTLSLVSQVVYDFRKLLNDFGMSKYEVETTYNADTINGFKVYILTQEKAMSAFSQKDNPFGNLRLLVIDEIQNIERVVENEDHRSKILYDLMIDLKNTTTIDHIILSGPRIKDLDKLGSAIFQIDSAKSETKSSPVISLTYAIEKARNKYLFKLYSDLLPTPLEVVITDASIIDGFGKDSYSEEFLNFLSTFVKNVEVAESNIIFAPTTNASRKIAEKLANDSSDTDSTYLYGLSQYIASTVHPKFTLCATVKKGIVYHHGKLPHHVRIVIEDGIKSQKIKNVVCTTTLLQGVNLPVQNIIIRNPNLFTKKIKDRANPKLTNYEIANLRGRAGRLLKDFIGRTYILDENSFDEDSQGNSSNLLNSEGITLRAGYKEKFQEHKRWITRDLSTSVGHTSQNAPYAYLTTYIRQAIQKFGEQSQEHLSRVGINLTDGQITEVYRSLKELNIPSDILKANRYWDPYDLLIIKNNINSLDIPTSPNELNISQKLKSILEFYKSNLPVYFERYFPVIESEEKDVLLQKCILAENWLKEGRLSDILSDGYYDSSEKIENAIKFLQNDIAYGLPMLLKPLYNLNKKESMFPAFIEMGAYKPEVRKLIELNIPRETAIYLNSINSFKNMTTRECINKLRNLKNGSSISYWYKVQIGMVV